MPSRFNDVKYPLCKKAGDGGRREPAGLAAVTFVALGVMVLRMVRERTDSAAALKDLDRRVSAVRAAIRASGR